MAIRLFWFHPPQGRNFGDEITPRIVEMVSGRAVEHAPTASCALVALGSVLDQALGDYARAKRTDPLAVWGTGFMRPRTAQPLAPAIRIHALRGPLTRCGIEAASGVALGDPGLLANELFAHLPATKTHRIGLIAHKNEKGRPEFAELAATLPGCRRINVTASDPDEVAAAIKGSDFVLSSSLHGLIVADAFGVPNAWLKVSEIHPATEFKFYDYGASVGRMIEPRAAADFADGFREELFGLADPARIAALCDGLRAAFPRDLA